MRNTLRDERIKIALPAPGRPSSQPSWHQSLLILRKGGRSTLSAKLHHTLFLQVINKKTSVRSFSGCLSSNPSSWNTTPPHTPHPTPKPHPLPLVKQHLPKVPQPSKSSPIRRGQNDQPHFTNSAEHQVSRLSPPTPTHHVVPASIPQPHKGSVCSRPVETRVKGGRVGEMLGCGCGVCFTRAGN